MTTCTTPGCPELVEQPGKCPQHARQADLARGTAKARGYGKRHRLRFRKAVLERDVVCVECRQALATVADHWPRSRRELVELGLDADDPQYGRGLCASCHSSATATNPDQAGGWNRR